MKKIILILFLIFYTNERVYSQVKNGVYETGFTKFINENNPSKNFSEYDDSLIIVDIYEYPQTYGSVTLTIKDDEETANIKFVLTGEKNVGTVEGTKYIIYKANIYLLDQKTKAKCTIGFDSKMTTITILYENGSSQTWGLSKI